MWVRQRQAETKDGLDEKKEKELGKSRWFDLIFMFILMDLMLCATIPVQQLQNCSPNNPAPGNNHHTATEIPSSLQAQAQAGNNYFKIHHFIISALRKQSRILNYSARMIKEKKKKKQGYTWTWSFKSLLKILAVTKPDLMKTRRDAKRKGKLQQTV